MSTIKILMGLEKLKLCNDCGHEENYHSQRGCKALECLCGFQ